MAGGTGGHIFPALAVAEALAIRKVPVVWLGADGGMETRLVPQHGIEIKTIGIKGLRGKGVFTLVTAPFTLSLAVMQAIRILMDLKPRAVLGMGGFAAGPGGIAAFITRTPLFVHEQNAIPGMTNRWLAKVSQRVMQGFEGAFPEALKPLHVGNPVRQNIIAIAPPVERFATRTGLPRLLVVGGSLGAKKFNEVVPDTLAMLASSMHFLVTHQSGEKTLKIAQNAYAEAGIDAEVTSFIDDMAAAYAQADLVIARSGALTVAELEQVGVASILVPYPHAVDDHQTANGEALVRVGAATMIKDDELTSDVLLRVLKGLLGNREKLEGMALAANTLAKPDAAQRVASICLEEITVRESSAT